VDGYTGVVVLLLNSPRGCWHLPEMGQADLGLSQGSVTQTQPVPRLSPLSAGWSRRPDL